MSRILVVTNDFPTRRGGIEAFVLSLCTRLPSDGVVVYTASMPGDREFDAGLDFPVIRDRTSMLLPTPRVAKRTSEVLRAEGCDSVMFGAAAPLGLLADRLHGEGAARAVGLTHGHETWWARAPLARRALRRIGDTCDVLTYVSRYCRDEISRGLSPEAAARMVRLAPAVDTATFRPGVGGDEVRKRLDIAPDQPVLMSVSRLVARKGQDMLIKAMPQIVRGVPDALLVLVGDGPYRRKLERMAAESGVSDHIRFIGSVPWDEAPQWFDAADVFAGPSRTRLAGLEPEALGIVFLEAQAAGKPVLVGASGGAVETVQHEITGYGVDPHDPADIAARAITLLSDRDRAREMGRAGRAWVEREWTWDASVSTLRSLLHTS